MPVFGEKRLQPFDPTLEKIAMLGTTADRLIYTIAVDTWAEAMLTTAGRALLDDADATAQRATLGLGTMATQSASAVAITGGTIGGITDLAVADGGTGTSTGSITGTGALTFTAGGTNQDVTLTPSGTGNTILGGNVGIGTASPTAKLHLVDDGTGIKITRGTITTQWFTTLDGPAYMGTETADDFHIRTNAGNRITILSSGNVGIGTASPANPLHIRGLSQTAGSLKHILRIDDTTATAQDGGPGVRFVGQYSGGDIDYGGIGAYKSSGTTSDTGTYLSFHVLTNPATTPTEKMRIDTSGNVGIGTTTPTAVLHLKAGTATANTAPLKLTAGTNLTTPENGAIEFDGTNIYITIGGVRKTIQVA